MLRRGIGTVDCRSTGTALLSFEDPLNHLDHFFSFSFSFPAGPCGGGGNTCDIGRGACGAQCC